METKFNHSIKIPTQYRAAASTLRKTLEEGESVQNQIFNAKHVVSLVWLFFIQTGVDFFNQESIR